MRTLHELPRFSDRWSYLYLEMGAVDRDAGGLAFHNEGEDTPIPIDQLSLLMLGPGTTVTHAAVKALAENNCLLAWVARDGTRLYAHSTGGTFSSRRLLDQARKSTDKKECARIACRMFQFRFKESLDDGLSLSQLRGMEGRRVRRAYQENAKRFHIVWKGRNYDQDEWFRSESINRAISTASACLYGVCYAAILSAGYSPALGFIHTGKMLSFVYDVADLYKTELVIPTAFETVVRVDENIERAVRVACRKAFHDAKLMDRLLGDIAEVLDARDDYPESAEELEGRAVSLADGTDDRGLPGEPEREGEGRTLEQSD